jgi:hypothetical protein
VPQVSLVQTIDALLCAVDRQALAAGPLLRMAMLQTVRLVRIGFGDLI